jgi:hypothetical protein
MVEGALDYFGVRERLVPDPKERGGKYKGKNGDE